MLCALWLGVCVGVRGPVDISMCWHTKFFSFFLCLLCLLLVANAAAAVSCLYHTVSQALELSTLWQQRHSRSRKESLCGPHLCVCVGNAYAFVDVCDMSRKHLACDTTSAAAAAILMPKVNT